MQTKTYGFIGLGLIGGSIARAIREKITDARIVAYDIHAASLQAALSDGVIDQAAGAIDETFSGCSYLFLCAPVQKNDNNLSRVKQIISKECLLTDVGSVKTGIHHAVQAAGLSDQFIGGHPMTGSERIGYVNSKARLLENAYYILSPTDTVPSETIADYRALVEALGAIPLVLDCKQHDYATAAISHLPHVIAAALVNLVHDSDNAEGTLKMIAAGGFKDITRIASSSAQMWQQICLTNTDNIAALLDNYIAALNKVRTELAVHDPEALYTFFDNARIYRDSFINTPSGPIKADYSIRIDIADEPGALAAIATILALHQISIKNIGIVHNREAENGVLRIELYDAVSIQKAQEILQAKGYTVYTKK